MTRSEKDRALSDLLDAINAPLGNGSDLRTHIGELLDKLGVWEVAHQLRTLPATHAAGIDLFLAHLAQEHPAAADRIQILLSATKGEDKELMKREFGGD